LEKEPHNEYLQTRHCNHHDALDNAEIEYPTLCTPDRAKIAVFACTEVFLIAIDGGKLAREFEDGFFQRGLLVRCTALFAGQFSSGFVFNLRVRLVSIN